MPAFDFLPDAGPTNTPSANVIEAKFGDGYSQRQAIGMNPIADSWSLSFSNREKSEGDQIDAFLKARMGVESFDFVPPGGTDYIKVVCRTGQWNVKKLKAGMVTVNAKFEQVFEP